MNLKKQSGRVVLVGAGVNFSLITVRGRHEVRQADVIVYDELLDDALLSQAKKDCEIIYVGKRRGAHSMEQDKINALLIKKAKEGKRVVRLKGGDSFVFGRGSEECRAIAEADIPVEVVPGVTSAVAVPESMGIPVTDRGIARSFTVVTGHPMDGESYEALAVLSGTIVFLMAHAHFDEISKKLISCGKSPDTPAAVISNGCMPDAKRIDGTLDGIARLSHDLPTPAIFVVGRVAEEQLFSQKTYNRRVLVTGTEKFTDKALSHIHDIDIPAVGLSCLDIIPMDAPEIERIAAPDSWDRIVFTSMNGVSLFFKKYYALHPDADARAFLGIGFACIGPGTASELMSHGIRADLVPQKHTSEALGELLAERCRDEKILILRAKEGSRALNDILDQNDIAYDDVPIYQTVRLSDKPMDTSGFTDVIFASAAGADAFFSSYKLPRSARSICIGEHTAEAVKRHTGDDVIIAKEENLDGIISALCEY